VSGQAGDDGEGIPAARLLPSSPRLPRDGSGAERGRGGHALVRHRTEEKAHPCTGKGKCVVDRRWSREGSLERRLVLIVILVGRGDSSGILPSFCRPPPPPLAATEKQDRP